MVVSWILNSISKDIAEAFLYTTSARNLWLELESRFSESNGPLLYQIQREIASMTRGNKSVAVYSTRLKKLWDELTNLDPLPARSFGASKKLAEQIAFNQLMQFLMGLSDAYDHSLHHLDVNSAFLVRNLDETIYMDPPEGYEVLIGMVFKLKKSLYGLKQATRNREVTEKNKALGFVQ
ncbi:UNVERIFIED_CONTAM: Retrovirus-related Pol polyprotein from transposon TNT 1-94 [Sesamum indicum]